MAKLLLVEDDRDLNAQIQQWLSADYHLIDSVHTVGQAEEYLLAYQYDLILLDWDLPDKSGLELCRRLRSEGNNTPILLLTGKSSLNNKETGFDAGVDDYLTKPFALAEVGFRVKALLRRRTGRNNGNAICIRNVCLEPDGFRVTVQDKEVRLLPKEFALLEFLMRHPGQVFSPQTLLNRIWSSSSGASPEAVSVCLRRLRHKVERDQQRPFIATVHGVGYRLEA